MSIRVLTYNLWHGLDGQGILFFGELEPQGRKISRTAIQIQQIKQQKADLLLFQELNPLYPAVYYYAEQLECRALAQLDLCGIKFMGIGPPFNLQSGLSIMTRSPWDLRFKHRLKLSGPGPTHWGAFSLQVKESRYALMGEFTHNEWGEVLVINLHLHHGVEFEAHWLEEWESWRQEGKITREQKKTLESQLRSGDERRAHEINQLFVYLQPIISRYDLVLLGGDFNSQPESRVAQKMKQNGFIDSWSVSHSKEPGYTWDPGINQINHKYNENFKSRWVPPKEMSLSAEALDLLKNQVRQAEEKPRRIDFLYFYTPHEFQVESTLFLGQDSKDPTFFGSDHLGVLVEISRK